MLSANTFLEKYTYAVSWPVVFQQFVSIFLTLMFIFKFQAFLTTEYVIFSAQNTAQIYPNYTYNGFFHCSFTHTVIKLLSCPV